VGSECYTKLEVQRNNKIGTVKQYVQKQENNRTYEEYNIRVLGVFIMGVQ